MNIIVIMIPIGYVFKFYHSADHDTLYCAYMIVMIMIRIVCSFDSDDADM